MHIGGPSVNLLVADVADVPFAVTSLDDAVEHVLDAAGRGVGQNLRFANAYCLALAHRDDDYHRVLASDGINFPDGTPVVWVLKMRLKSSLRQRAGRVRGPSFFEQAIDRSQGRGIRHYFLGGTPETLELLEEWVRREYPGAEIAGSYSPPFGPVDEQFVRSASERIEAADPNIVWVGLGTPKQDYASSALAELHGKRTFASVGAAFDFKAGTVVEAPRWIQNSGFEWAYRFLREPRRLWKRYLVGNLVFILAVIKGKKRSEARITA